MIKQNEKTMIQNNSSKTAMPDKILQQVEQVQTSSQSRDRRYAWLIAACVLAITMIVAMVIEAQLNLFSHALRFALTALSLVVTAICGWAFWQRGKRQNERLVAAAKQVDAAFPSLEQRVSTLTSVEEDRRNSKLTAHPAMLNRLAVEASGLHEAVEPKPVVSQKVLKLPLKCLTAAGLVMLGLLVWDAPKTMVQLGRFWAPWANLSVTGVASVEENSVVARYEPIKLTASLTGRPVEELELAARTVKDGEVSETRLWPSSKDPSVASFRQAKAVESFDYRFRAGDGQTKWHRVTVADRPKIEDLKMRIVPPEYTGKPAKTFDKLPKKLRVVAGSRLEIDVKPKTDVRTARLVMGATNWLPMEIDGSGSYEGTMELRQPVNFEVQLTELHGLTNRRPPKCRLQVAEDQAPRVKIVRPTKTAVLLPDETIDIHFKASDDFGIKEMALRVYTQREGEAQPTVHEVPIPLDDEKNRRKIQGSVALDLAQFDLQDGDTIRYEVRASDNFMPLESLFDPTETQPMSDVELVQNGQLPQANGNANQLAEANPNANVQPSNPVTAEADDPNRQVAQAGNTSNTAAPKNADAPSKSNDAANAQAGTQAQNAQAHQANGDPSAQAQNAQAQNSQTQPANGDPSDQAQASKNEPAAGDMASKPNNANADDPTGDQPVGEKPSPDQVAENSSENDPASNQNKIQSRTEKKDAPAEAPSEQELAKSDGGTQKEMPKDPSSPAAESSQANGSKPSNSDQANSSQANSSSKPSDANQANASKDSQSKDSSQPNNSSQANSSQSSQSSSSGAPKMASDESEKPDADKPNAEKLETEPNVPSESDPVQMAQRSLDVGGQSSSSGSQQIKVDKYAGGFTSEHRNKLEIAIAPVLDLLQTSLQNAGSEVQRVMNPTTADPATGSIAVKALEVASDNLKQGSEAVIGLNRVTKNTPYAFVGLRLESIRTADVVPAWDDVRKAIDADGQPRMDHSSAAWNHISRALATLGKLTEKYEQVKRDLKRADDIQKFKKMHRIFIENTMAMLNPSSPGMNGQSRKAVEFDLDEEYLERLKEVMKMRQEMMAELARILADDPQLLRRYMNGMNSRTSSIRDQLSLIAGEQRALSYRVEQWSNASMQLDPELTLRDHIVNETDEHLAKIQNLGNRLFDVQDEFVSWLPLADDAEKGDAAETLANFKAAGIELSGIAAEVNTILVGGGLKRDLERQAQPLLEKATAVDKLLGEVSRSLQRMSNDQTNVELANNATRRLPILKMVRRDTQQWAGELELLVDGLINETYSVEQENRRDQLLEYNVKIASLESQLTAAMPSENIQVPDEAMEKAKELIELLDVEVPADQLTAAQTLSDGDATAVKPEQASIVANFEKAELLFDEILQALADELDKLPVQDPIASLLEDPTLDEILAELEDELDILEELGLSQRPNNLQVMGDRRRSGQMSSMMRRLMAQRQRMRNLSNQAYRNALERAKVKKGKRKPKLAKDDRRWNLLVSELDEDMLQGDKKVPPQRYRSAIDQYFETISKLKNGQDSE